MHVATECTVREFMELNFDFSSMKKAGIYPKELKRSDHDGQAAIICRILGLHSIFDYLSTPIYCHISYAKDPFGFDEEGNLEKGTIPEHRTFVEQSYQCRPDLLAPVLPIESKNKQLQLFD